MREVEDIDLRKQIVTISPGFRPRQLQLKYDHLVIALGNITDFHGMPGLMENAMPFRTLADAMALRKWLRLRSSGVLMPIAAKGRQRPTNR
jgi:NADH dehydrogenase